MQIVSRFFGNADHQIKKRKRFHVGSRFSASVSINRREPKISGIVKNGDLSRSSSLKKISQVLPAQITKNVRHKEDIAWCNLLLESNPLSPEKTPKLSEWVLAAKFGTSQCMWSDVERLR
jgi:hypothetical protein